MKCYGLHGKLKAKDGQARALAEILLKAADLVSQYSECLIYQVSIDSDDLNSVWVTETWTDQEAHKNSLTNPDIRALIGEAMPLLDGMPEGGQVLTVLGGHGLT